MADADCVVAFGASLNKHTAGPALAGKRIVHCDVDPQRIGAFTNVDVAVLGDAKAVAAAMVDGLVRRRASRSRPATPTWPTGWRPPRRVTSSRTGATADTLDLRTAMVVLDEQLPPSIAPW